ncbi:Fc.00g039510.m01.CDS01 [Cosmosporella sp. VM-42]
MSSSLPPKGDTVSAVPTTTSASSFSKIASQTQNEATSSPPATGCPSCHHPKLGVGEGFGIGFGVGIILLSLFIAGVYIFTRGKPLNETIRGALANARRTVSHGRDHNMRGLPTFSKTRQKVKKPRQRQLTESVVPALEESRVHVPPIMNVLDCLPQPIGYDDLRLELNRVETPIKNWVDNFFHSKNVPFNDFQEDQLVALAGESNAGDTWIARLADANTRPNALRCFVAQVVFRSMDLDYDPAWSLLPPGVVNSYRQIMESQEAQSQPYLRATWRQLTTYLLREKYSPYRINTDDPRRNSIKLLASTIIAAVGPIRNQKTPDRCISVLEGILHDAAILAFKLFSQEDEWEASWTSKKPGIVVFPRLLMVGFNEQTSERVLGRVSQAVVVE